MALVDSFTNIYRREWRIFAILARGAADAKSVEQWVRKKAFNTWGWDGMGMTMAQ